MQYNTHVGDVCKYILYNDGSLSSKERKTLTNINGGFQQGAPFGNAWKWILFICLFVLLGKDG